MPSLPFGRGSRLNPADGQTDRNESFATRVAATKKTSGGIIAAAYSNLNAYINAGILASPVAAGRVLFSPICWLERDVTISYCRAQGGAAARSYGALYYAPARDTAQKLELLPPTVVPLDGTTRIVRLPSDVLIPAGAVIFQALSSLTAGVSSFQVFATDPLVLGTVAPFVGGLLVTTEMPQSVALPLAASAASTEYVADLRWYSDEIARVFP
jgi:hypothetical protein